MSERGASRFDVMLIIAFIAAVLVIATLPLIPWPEALKSSTASGWAQAIGSVGALAITLTLWRQDRNRERVQAIAAAHVFVGRLLVCLETLYSSTATGYRKLVQQEGDVLEQLHRFSGSLRLDPIPQAAIWEFFSLVTICAEARRLTADGLKSTHVLIDTLKPEFEELGNRASKIARAFASATGEASVVAAIRKQLGDDQIELDVDALAMGSSSNI